MNDVRLANGGPSRLTLSWRSPILGAAIAATIFMWSGPARAEIPLKNAKGWTLSLDGRLNTFVSFMNGEAQPAGIPEWNGGVNDRYATGSTSIRSTRIRSGFIANVFGFNLAKPLTDTVKVTGRFALWVALAEKREKTDRPGVDTRELYIKIEGGFGSLTLGRNLALFGRGGILMDYDVQHAYGMGFPCGVIVAPVASCGYAGHGLLFPSFNPGIVYTTPSLGGLELAIGAYDPASVAERNYDRTPYPRVEGQISFRFREVFRAWAEVLWQRIGTNQNASNTLTVDANGVSGGLMVKAGPLALGGSAYKGKGLGIYVPMENHPLFADNSGVLRGTQGAVAIASVTFGANKLAAGGGITQIKTTAAEDAMTAPTNGVFSSQPPAKQQLGLSVGYYRMFSDTLVLALEYFRGQYQWYQLLNPDTMLGESKHQNVNFVNVGLTLLW